MAAPASVPEGDKKSEGRIALRRTRHATRATVRRHVYVRNRVDVQNGYSEALAKAGLQKHGIRVLREGSLRGEAWTFSDERNGCMSSCMVPRPLNIHTPVAATWNLGTFHLFR